MRKVYLSIIFLLLSSPALLSFVSIHVDGYANYKNLADSMNEIWQTGKSLVVKIQYNRTVYPTSYLVREGEYFSGDITSFLADDDNDFLVKVDDIMHFEMYVFLYAKRGGWLNVHATYDMYSTSNPSTPLVVDVANLNISVFNTITQTFDIVGEGEGSFWIDEDYIAGDNRIVVKIDAGGEVNPSYFFMAKISYLYLRIGPDVEVIPTEYKAYDGSTILHRIRLDIKHDNATVSFLNLSRWWHFLYSEPAVTWDYPNRTIKTKVKGTYYVYFISKDYWNYPVDQTSKIVLVNSRGDLLPFDLFDVYYRLIESKLVEKENYLFVKNISISLAFNFSLYNYPITIELNESTFNFLAVNPDLSDIELYSRIVDDDNKVKFYIRYWDGKKAIFRLRPSILSQNSPLIILYGSEYNTTEWFYDIEGLTLLDNEFYSQTEIEGWDASDNDWFILDVTDELAHSKTNNHTQIIAPPCFSPFVSVNSLIEKLQFDLEDNVYAGAYLLYNNSENYYGLKIEKSNGIGRLMLFEVHNGQIRYETSSMVQLDFIDSVKGMNFTAKLNAKENVIEANVSIFDIDSVVYNYQLVLSNITIIDGGRFGYFANNTAIAIDYVTLEYENLTKLYGGGFFEYTFGEEEIFGRAYEKITVYGNYERLYTNVLDVPSDALANIILKDMFSNIIANVTTSPLETIIIPLEVKSLKIKNNRDDIFVHVTLMKEGTFFNWSEWLAPLESTEYLLYPGSYTLRIDYASQSAQSAAINMNIRDDVYLLINGTVLGDLLMQLQKVNDTLFNQIQNIDLYISNINSTLGDMNINFRVHIENVNSSLASLITNVQLNLTDIYSHLNNSITDLAVYINDVSSIIQDLNISMVNNFDLLNTSISKIILDLQSNVSLIYSEIGILQDNISANFILLNSSIGQMVNDIITHVISLNSTITEISLDVNSRIMSINTTMGTMILNLSTMIMSMNSTINNVLLSVLHSFEMTNSSVANLVANITELLEFSNTTLVNTVWNLIDNMIFINTSMWELMVDLDNYLISINSTLENFIADLNTGIIAINAQIHYLNETLLVSLYDMQLNLSKTILLSLDQISNLTETILSFVNVFKIRLYSVYTREKVDVPGIKIYVNGTRIYETTITTIGNILNITIKDYWGRVIWSNLTSERDIRAYLSVGRLAIINEKDESIYVIIAPENYSDYITIIIPPLEYYNIMLYCLSKYNITIKTEEQVLSQGVFDFVISETKEPVILLRVTKNKVIPFPTESQDMFGFAISFMSGIGLSALSLGVYRLFFARRYLVSAEELLREIVSNEETRRLLLQLTASSSDEQE